MTEASEEQIAALRGAIWRRWRSYRWWWGLGLAWTAFLPLVLLPLIVIFRREPYAAWFVAMLGGWNAGLIILGLALKKFLRHRRAEIGAVWDRLSVEDRAEALRPIAARTGRLGPMSELVSPFLRQSFSAAEISPADAPTGRGDEPTP